MKVVKLQLKLFKGRSGTIYVITVSRKAAYWGSKTMRMATLEAEGRLFTLAHTPGTPEIR